LGWLGGPYFSATKGSSTVKEPEKLVVKANESDTVTALLYAASKKDRLGMTVLLGHGAGRIS